MLLPKRNERDLKDVPKEVKEALKFIFVETVEEALQHVLGLQAEHWAGAPITSPAPPVNPTPSVGN